VAAPEPNNIRPALGVWRALELDAPEHSTLDPHSIVIGSHDLPSVAPPPQVRPESTLVWQGEMAGDGTGPQSTYYVRLYTDGTGHCSCPDYYFRGLLRRQARFRCKHLVRAWAAHGASGNPATQGS
jgi:hypothetical protein